MLILITANLDENPVRFRLPLIQGLLAAGNEVHVAAPDTGSLHVLDRLGARTHDLPRLRGPRSRLARPAHVAALRRLLRDVRPDLLHSFTHQANVAARLSGWPGPMLGSVTGLGWPFLGQGLASRLSGGLLGRLYTWTSGPRRALLFQNPDDLTFFRTRGFLGASPALIAPSSVDTQRFRPGLQDGEGRAALRAALGLAPGACAILQASRFLAEKGIATIRQAALLTQNLNLNIKFFLAGRPDAGNPGSIAPESLSPTPGLTVLPWREDMPEVWSACDAALLASRGEGLPSSLLEAGACGLPLLASDVAGCREVVRPGHNGLLFPPGDAVALAACAKELTLDPESRARFGAAARADILARFRPEAAVDWFLDLYRDGLGRAGRPVCAASPLGT